LVLVAKHAYSHSQLAILQRKNAISRTYVAVVSGRLKQVSGSINAPIGRKETSLMERVETEKGKNEVKTIEVIKQFELLYFIKYNKKRLKNSVVFLSMSCCTRRLFIWW